LNKLLEIACFNLHSALIAQASGADRIELCEDYEAGGLTPSHANIKEARKQIHIPLHVIIRPHKENFVYSPEQIDKMMQDILFCKEQKINGVVFGLLNKNNEIDKKFCKELILIARPMSVTFHRAIDVCNNLETSFEDLIESGIDRVLTSGGKNNCIEGLETLKSLQKTFGNKITIMPGGGIRSGNISEIVNATQAMEYHSAAIMLEKNTVDKTEVELMKQLTNT
jgi:copper homeostasis protein